MSNNYYDDVVRELVRTTPDMFYFWGLNPLARTLQADKKDNGIGVNGLKAIISRPHNLYVSENEAGEITAYHVDLVYTPFHKEDISMEILDDVLTISVGSKEDQAEADKKHPMVYRGISAKPFSFQLYIRNFFDEGEEIDLEKIRASAVDGILSLTFPLKEKPPAPEAKPIKIQLA